MKIGISGSVMTTMIADVISAIAITTISTGITTTESTRAGTYPVR